jgi:hypothetical protein
MSLPISTVWDAGSRMGRNFTCIILHQTTSEHNEGVRGSSRSLHFSFHIDSVHLWIVYQDLVFEQSTLIIRDLLLYIQ